MPKRLLFPLLAGFMLAIALIAGAAFAQSGPANAPPPAAGDADSALVIAISSEPGTLYVFDQFGGPGFEVLAAIFDGPVDLVSPDYLDEFRPVILQKLPSLDDGDALLNEVTVDDGDLVLDAQRHVITLAPGAQIINSAGELIEFDGTPVYMNQLQVTFTLLDDIYWNDGQPLTAGDSLFGYQTDCHPDTPSDKTQCDRTAEYVAPNDHTAVWTGIPGWMDPAFVQRFWMPLPEHVLGSVPPADIPGSAYATAPLGWGPYQIDEWLPGEYIELSRNPYYWRAGLPHIERLRFVFLGDRAALWDQLLTGGVHVATASAVGSVYNYMLDWDADGALTLHSAPSDIYEHFDFNLLPADDRYAFFEERDVRRAVAHCLDRQAMADAVYLGLTDVMHAYLPADHPLYLAAGATEYDYDPPAGRALLDGAGWLVGADGWRYQDGQRLAFTLMTTDTQKRRQMAAHFQADMAQCGMDVSLEFWPALDFFADGPDGPVFGRQYDVAEFAWSIDVEPFCYIFVTDQIGSDANGWVGYQNNLGYSDAQFDQACLTALGQPRGAAQYDANHALALERFTADLPSLYLFPRVMAALTNPNLLNFQITGRFFGSNQTWNVEEWSIAVEEVIEPDGGEAASNDGRAQVIVPSGAFSETVILTLEPIAPPAGGLRGPAQNLVPAGQTYNVAARYADTGEDAQLTGGSTIELEISYSLEQLIFLGAHPNGLGIYSYQNGNWLEDDSSQLDLQAGTVTANPGQLGIFALFSDQELKTTYLPLALGH